MLRRLRRNRYSEVRVFVVTRLQYCMTRSQVEHHLRYVAENDRMARAERNVSEAMYRISKFVYERGLPVQYVTYESVVHNFRVVRCALAQWGLDLRRAPERIYDGNTKYAGNRPGTYCK